MEEDHINSNTMFKHMLATLDEYEMIIRQFKEQLERMQLSRKLMEASSTVRVI